MQQHTQACLLSSWTDHRSSWIMTRDGMIFRRMVSLVVAALTLLVVVAPPPADGQPTGRAYTIGLLATGSPSSFADIDGPFRGALAQLGYVEKRNLVIQQRFDEGAHGRLDTSAAELVRINVDVIVAYGTPASLAAKQATSSIPIVMVSTGDPVGSGLVRSLGRPGGNVTGVSAAFADIAGKWIELLRYVVPKLSRIAFLGNAENPVNKLVFKRAQTVARDLGMTIEYASASTPDGVSAALTRIHKARVQGVIVSGDNVIRSRRSEITEFAARVRLPAVYFGNDYIEAGGLMSFGPDRPEIGRHAAAYVDKILKGAKPADLPVEEPTKFELVISLKTARALNLMIPQSLLLRADRVID
jgi:putative ABC transport system substrate-binding protein